MLHMRTKSVLVISQSVLRSRGARLTVLSSYEIRVRG